MSRNPGYQSNIEIQALKKPMAVALDLMKPGDGTPWEDRGSIGAVPAYFKTVLKSLFSPSLLLDHIRRPETTSDSDGFKYISLAMWVVGALLYNLYWLLAVLPQSTAYEHELDSPLYYWLSALGQGLLMAGGWYLLGKLGSKMYVSMAGNELKGVSPALIENCYAYCLGPSILAVFPVVGWVIASVWILIDVIAAGKKRLYLKSSSAIVNPLLIAVAVVFAVVVVYFVVGALWGPYLGLSGLATPPPPKAHPSFGAPTT